MVLLKDLDWEPYHNSDDWHIAWVTHERAIYQCMVKNHPTTPTGHYWAMIKQGGRIGVILDPVEAQCLVNQWLTEEGNDERS